MPNYSFQAPDGNTYTLAGPAGATQDQVRAEVLRQHPTAGQAKAREEGYKERVKRTGDAVNRAAGKGPIGYARAAVGAVEDVTAIGAGVVGDVAGAATSIATQNPAIGTAVRKALMYQPHTATGRAGLDYAAALTAPIGKLAAAAPEALEKHGFPIAAQTVQAMIDVAPGVPKALRPAAQAGVDAARTISLGWHLRPTDMGAGLAARGTQAAVGGDEMAKAFSIKNQPVSTALVASELRLPRETKITPKVLDEVKERENLVYREVGAMGPVLVPPGARQHISSIGTGRPGNPEVQNLKRTWANKQVVDANTTLDDIDALRSGASASFKAGKKELGMAQREVAKTLENILSLEAFQRAKTGRGAADLGPRYAQARRTLAQLRDIRKAMIPGTGEVSAKKLGAIEAKAIAAGRPHFSGNLKVVADTALKYPEVFQDGPKIIRKGTNIGIKGMSLTAAEVALGIYHPAVAGAVAAVAAARPLVRKAMGTRPVQKVMSAAATAPKGGLGKTKALGAAAVASNQADKQSKAGYDEPAVNNLSIRQGLELAGTFILGRPEGQAIKQKVLDMSIARAEKLLGGSIKKGFVKDVLAGKVNMPHPETLNKRALGPGYGLWMKPLSFAVHEGAGGKFHVYETKGITSTPIATFNTKEAAEGYMQLAKKWRKVEE